MLETSLQSIITATKNAAPLGVDVSYNQPDHQKESHIQVVIDSAPTPFDDLAEKNGLYTADVSVILRAKVTSAGNGGQSIVHNLIDTTTRALRNLKPDGAANFVQADASDVSVEGEQANNVWFKCTLSYILTLDYNN